MPVLPQHLLAAIVVFSSFGALVMCLLVLRYGFAAPPEETGEARQREMVTRLGHAVAGACFAAAAIVSVTLMARDPGGHPRSAPAERDGVEQTLATRVTNVTARLAVLESRVDAVESRVVPLEGGVAAARDRLGAMVARLERAAVESRVQEIEARLGPMERRLDRVETARVGEERQAPAAVRPAAAVPVTPDQPRAAGARWVPATDAPASPRSPVAPPPAAPPPRSSLTPPPREASAREPAPPRPPAPATMPASPGGPAPSATPPAPAPRAAGTPDTGAKPDARLGERIRDDWQAVRRGFADAGDDFRREVDSLRRNLRESFGR